MSWDFGLLRNVSLGCCVVEVEWEKD